MDDLLETLRRIANAAARLSHPPPSILAPGVVAMLLWLVLRDLWPFADPGIALTIAFCSSLIVLLTNRIQTMQDRRADLFDTATGISVPVVLILCVVILLVWQHNALWTQRYLTVHLGLVSIIHLRLCLMSPAADTRWLWPHVAAPALRRALSAGAFLWTLSAIVLNEYLIRFAGLSDWIIAWAFAPVVLHYTSVLTNQIVILSAPDDDFHTSGRV